MIINSLIHSNLTFNKPSATKLTIPCFSEIMKMSKNNKIIGRPRKQTSISNRRNHLRQKWREASNRYNEKIRKEMENDENESVKAV
jgi:hypothetical protein